MTSNEALIKQKDIIENALTQLYASYADIEDMLEKPTTWRDVSRYAHLIDALRRADLVPQK